jgi:hypothetical protein
VARRAAGGDDRAPRFLSLFPLESPACLKQLFPNGLRLKSHVLPPRPFRSTSASSVEPETAKLFSPPLPFRLRPRRPFPPKRRTPARQVRAGVRAAFLLLALPLPRSLTPPTPSKRPTTRGSRSSPRPSSTRAGSRPAT